MRTITLVTGNKNKLHEYEALLPKGSGITFTTHELDLSEIQSLDLEEVVRDKLRKAFDVLKSPVIVEDVSAGLNDEKNNISHRAKAVKSLLKQL